MPKPTSRPHPKPLSAPDAPTGLTATPGNMLVNLAWNAPANGGSVITAYRLYRNDQLWHQTAGARFYLDNTSLVAGSQYRYRVSAVNAIGEGPKSAEVSVTAINTNPPPVYTAPGAPASLSATAGVGLVNLAWTVPGSNGGTAITGYRVYRSGTSLIELGNVLTYQNTGLALIPYSYQVAAINAVGEGPQSVSKTATPLAATPPIAGFILIDRATLLSLPMSGTAWTAMKARADLAVGTPDISNQDDGADTIVLAKALVYARTSTTSYRTAALAGIKAAVGTETGAFPAGTSSALALGRNLAAYVLSADFISLPTLDSTYNQNVFRPWLLSLLTMTLDNRTLISNHEDRPNNWGTHAGASRAAVAAYLGNSVEMARTALVFRGYLGDRSAYAGFNYGELSWQASQAAPVGINPTGAVIGGVNVDGILPDDMRRGGSFPTVGDLGQSYTWEALQGILLQAELLSRNGYPAWGWSNNAIHRAFTRIHALGYPAAGDDRWTPWLVNRRYGSSFPASTTTTAGKGFGYADWLYG